MRIFIRAVTGEKCKLRTIRRERRVGEPFAVWDQCLLSSASKIDAHQVSRPLIFVPKNSRYQYDDAFPVRSDYR